ncbi:peptidoglycan-binding protein [Streptomyces sp. NBC_00638]|uniref:peptidoglycan-binding protein n=1 Tax=Streptomyces sp. NBC_00638 TaxID=2975794 RepID=UPI00225A2EB2|nr:peptidoglycan-binding protein [Streptomyces sp. NBC_00638]MCX5007980.1 peptidoglycan-binding protein [Streptomyces sp. NBC_00638]
MPTPPERGQPTGRSVIEPTHIQRRRRSESLAELLRQVRVQEGMDTDDGYEPVTVPATSTRLLPPPEEDETEELPPVLMGEDYTDGAGPADAGSGPATGRGGLYGKGHGSGQGRGTGLRRAAITVAVAAAALIGFALALLVPRAGQDDSSRTGAGANPSAASAAPAQDGADDPDGAGTLREGDNGPEVTALQQRLLRIPNVYDHGSTSGSYDADLTAAVARFQVWYGIRGDESGVYGNDTRADLESRTAAP